MSKPDLTIIQLNEDDLRQLIIAASKKGAELALAELEVKRRNDGEKRYTKGKDICKKFGISIQTLIRWRNAGKIPSYRVGGRVFYVADEVESYVKSSK